MDGFTLATIIKTLLASAGLKATLAILSVGGFFFVCYKIVQAVAAFFQRIIEKRDENMAQLARDLSVSQERCAAIDRETFAILAAIRADTASQLTEARDTRKEMHQRFNKLQEDVTTIRGATS